MEANMAENLLPRGTGGGGVSAIFASIFFSPYFGETDRNMEANMEENMEVSLLRLWA
jgi:hypothetical protein